MDEAERRRWVLATSLYLGERSHARIIRSMERLAATQRMCAQYAHSLEQAADLGYQWKARQMTRETGMTTASS